MEDTITLPGIQGGQWKAVFILSPFKLVRLTYEMILLLDGAEKKVSSSDVLGRMDPEMVAIFTQEAESVYEQQLQEAEDWQLHEQAVLMEEAFWHQNHLVERL